jgi:5-deoxy-glucuronate isomerase
MLIRSIDCGGTGIIARVDAVEAGWETLSMTVRRMNRGDTWTDMTGEAECVFVILGGQCTIRTSRGDFSEVGERPSVFEGLPYALYLSRHTSFTVEALTDGFEIALCTVPAEVDYPARLVTPADCTVDLRGGDDASRQVVNIIPPGFPCQRLVCVEAYIPPGNRAGWPPHKHDQHQVDADGRLLEADLDEIYFYKFLPTEGSARQRIYTAAGDSDSTFTAHQHDSVLIHAGYHPTESGRNCTTYLLNFLAGSAQSLANSEDPQYVWVRQTWKGLDPRLPIVR